MTLIVDAAFRVPPDWLKFVPTVRVPVAVRLPPASSSEASAALAPSIRAPPFIWTSPLPAPSTAPLKVAWPLPGTLRVPPSVVFPVTLSVPVLPPDVVTSKVLPPVTPRVFTVALPVNCTVFVPPVPMTASARAVGMPRSQRTSSAQFAVPVAL